jgi:acetyl-CoA carboxylase biotin carboxyl carrier protein
MIDIKNLRTLIKLMVENDLTELDVQGAQGERVSLKRDRAEGHAHAAPQAAASAGLPGALPAAPPATSASAPPSASAPTAVAPAQITSPIVGTFYAASTPDAKPFVTVGDRVQADTIVCIIEAMKVFNEIKAETSGVIDKILVSSGQAVEFGQPLFVIRPA